MAGKIQQKKVYRLAYGKTFTYRYADGRTVKSEPLKRWIKSLAIPPAWTDVEIDTDHNAKQLVIGRDAKKRKQYIYNPNWTKNATEDKFERILRFGSNLEKMRRTTGQHIKRRPVDERAVLACMTRMLDQAFFRPGAAGYTNENKTYGLTTLRRKHMTIKRDRIEFDYIGKSHQEQHRIVADKAVRKLLLELEKMQGHEIFDVRLPDGERKHLTARDLNEYIGEVMGEDFTAKDFRTWAGTVLMAAALDELGPATDEKIGKSNVVNAVKSVAQSLGNTPAVCRTSYIHPEVILQYEKGNTLNYFRRQLKRHSSKYMEIDEKATLILINHITHQGERNESNTKRH